MKYDDSLLSRVRNKVAWALMTFALQYIATPWYRGMIAGSIRYGLMSAEKDSRND